MLCQSVPTVSRTAWALGPIMVLWMHQMIPVVTYIVTYTYIDHWLRTFVVANGPIIYNRLSTITVKSLDG